MRALVFLCVSMIMGCQSGVELPRVASSLEAVKSLYRAACEPVPADEHICETSKTAINELIDVYSQVNE